MSGSFADTGRMGNLTLSVKERRRLDVLGRVRDGLLSVAAAAELLGVSERQAWRLKRRFAAGGDAGLVHRLRGRASNRKTDDATRAAVLKLYRARYAGFGPTLACEYLAKDGHDVSADTLGRWLRAEGLFERRRNRSTHRRRRPRRPRRGALVQMDGSWHDWLEGRGGAPRCCLMVIVDDATGRAWARFYDKETLAAAFDAFGRYARSRGLPLALYVDKAGIYRGEDAAGEPTVTQFGRAMSELGVELILANSPQAKGRVERMNGTLQDRLCKALRLAGASSIAAANALLDGSFLAAFNRRFAVAPKDAADAHRRVTRATRLADVLCEREARAVGRDWCVQWRGRVLQLDARHAALDLARPGRRVEVSERADGTLLVRYAGRRLTWLEVARRPARAKPARRPVTNNKRYKPAADHPFNRHPACPGSRPGR